MDLPTVALGPDRLRKNRSLFQDDLKLGRLGAELLVGGKEEVGVTT